MDEFVVPPPLEVGPGQRERFRKAEVALGELLDGGGLFDDEAYDLLRAAREVCLNQAGDREGVVCQHCGKPIRRLGSSWEHYSPTWQGRRCPGSVLGATPLADGPSPTRGVAG